MIRPGVFVFMLSIVGYPLVAPLPLLLGVPSRLVSVPFRAVVVGLSLWVLARRAFEGRPLSMRGFDLCFCLFWAVYIIRICIDASWAPEALRIPASEYFLFAIGVCFLPALAVRAESGAPGGLRAASLMLAIGITAVLCNAALVLTNPDAAANLLAARAETGTLDPISFSHLGVSTCVLGLWILSSPAASRAQLAGALAGVAIGLLGAVLGASRGPLLMLPVAVVAVGYRLSRFRGPRRTVAAACLVALIAAAATASVRYSESLLLISRLRSIGQDETRSQLLSEGWAAFVSHPLEGAGTEPLASYPHNLVLESFIAFGLLSGVLFVILLGVALVFAVVRLRESGERGWVSLLFLQYALGGMVSGSLYAAAPFWVLMAAVARPVHRVAGAPMPSVRAAAPVGPWEKS